MKQMIKYEYFSHSIHKELLYQKVKGQCTLTHVLYLSKSHAAVHHSHEQYTN